MNKVYWEIRKYDYETDEVNTLFEGKKAQVVSRFKKLENTKDINYVLNSWVAERYWDGYGWDFKEYELYDQYEVGDSI